MRTLMYAKRAKIQGNEKCLLAMSSAASMSSGASMIEATLAVPVLLLFIIFLIDLARYFFSFLIMSYAVHNAADLASKSQIEEKTTTTDCQNLPNDTTNPCYRYKALIQNLAQKAIAIADYATESSSSQSGRAHRIQFSNYKPEDNSGSGLTEILQDMAVIRPGERQKALFGGGNDKWYQHPTRAPLSNGPNWPQPGESWGAVLDAYPIEILMVATFKPITPFIPTLTLEAKAFTFRRTNARSIGGTYPPTQTPTPDGGNTPTPSPTPAGGPSPSPSAPIINCNCCKLSQPCGPLQLDLCINNCGGLING